MIDRAWIIFIGAPGCGKGTQVELLVKENGFSVVSVGNVLRENKNKVVAGGQTLGDLMDSGSLLPDDVVLDFVKDNVKTLIADGKDRLVFDGFPRSLFQAEWLGEIATEFDAKVNSVVYFCCLDDAVIKRILGRFNCVQCGKLYNEFFLKPLVDGVCDICGGTEFYKRNDDNETSLKKRLSEFHEKTSPVIDFYSKKGVLHKIDASADVSSVRNSVLKCLGLNEMERV